MLEKCYREKKTHWKHGGIVVCFAGTAAAFIGRYSDVPEEFPNVAHFHTVRINSIAGLFYTSESLRTVCDIWEKYGSGLTNMHGSTGDMVLLGTTTDKLEPIFAEFSSRGWDLGGSGSALEPRAVALARLAASGLTSIPSILTMQLPRIPG